MGSAAQYLAFGEGKIWMHLRDARRPNHDKDFHLLLYLIILYLNVFKSCNFIGCHGNLEILNNIVLDDFFVF